MQEVIFRILEIIGTVSFAISGTVVAIKAEFDAFGAIVVGCTVAVGGGIIRDILSGRFPPLIFSDLTILAIAFAVSTICFFMIFFNKEKFSLFDKKIEKINNYFDAIGLATFTIMGVECANIYSFFDNWVFSIILGAVTGVGGGLLRDIFTENKPAIFSKKIYAVASVFGAETYYLLRKFYFIKNTIIPTLVGIIIIVSLRFLATVCRWNLPKVKLKS